MIKYLPTTSPDALVLKCLMCSLSLLISNMFGDNFVVYECVCVCWNLRWWMGVYIWLCVLINKKLDCVYMCVWDGVLSEGNCILEYVYSEWVWQCLHARMNALACVRLCMLWYACECMLERVCAREFECACMYGCCLTVGVYIWVCEYERVCKYVHSLVSLNNRVV